MSVWGKNGESPKREFCLKRKITCETFQDLLKSCVSFGGGLEGSNERNGEATGGASIVKCGETPLECWGGGGGSL